MIIAFQLEMIFILLLLYPGIGEMAKYGHRSRLERTLENVVPKNYDPLERPSIKGGPTTVHVSVHLSHIEWRDDRLITVMYLRQTWTDHRLKRKVEKPHTILCKPADLQNHLWFPDTFLANMIEETKVLNAGFVRVNSEGEIVHSSMLKSTLSCPRWSTKRLITTDGVAQCEIALESFAYSADEVALKWSKDKAATCDESYNDKVTSVATGEMAVRLTRGAYSRLAVNLTINTGLDVDAVDLAIHWFYNR